MSKIDCTITKNDFGYNCVLNAAAARIIPKTLLAGEVYERDTIEIIKEHRGDGIVVHAGAFIGDMLPALSGPSNRIYAFEPGEEFFRCCEITMALNFADNEHDTTLIRKGLGAEQEFVRLLTKSTETLSEGGVSRIMTHPDGVEPYRMETIEVTTIDLSVPPGVSLIHLDVEGFEEQALKGAVMHLRTSKPVLILEVHEGMFETPFFQEFIFGELGYKMVGERFSGNQLLLTET